MARVVQEVCDVCRNPNRKVRDYRVASDGNRILRVVLCAEHGKPLEDIIKVGQPTTSNAPGARMWSIEEIEKEKRRQHRNAE